MKTQSIQQAQPERVAASPAKEHSVRARRAPQPSGTLMLLGAPVLRLSRGTENATPQQQTPTVKVPADITTDDTPGREPSVSLRRKAVKELLSFKPDEATANRWRRDSKGTALPSMDGWSERLGVSLPQTYLHVDHMSDLLTMAHDAEAITIGHHIYFSANARTPGLLAHEIAHVAQSTIPGSPATRGAREEEANAVQRSILAGRNSFARLPGVASEPMRHPAARILLRTGRWLLTRTTRALTRHIARHGRRIAGRAIHSIFRNPRAIRDLVSVAIRDATAVARNATSHGAETVLEQGGVRIFTQGRRAPGAFRLIVEKDFGREIGTRGERILRVVLDMSGRVVTAFPVDRFLVLGLGVAAVNIFGERSAEASGRIRSRIEAEQNRPTDWVGEILDFLNPLSGGSLNEGEDTMLAIDRIVEETTVDIIREIEESEQMCLNTEQRRAIADLVRAGLGGALNLEHPEED